MANFGGMSPLPLRLGGGSHRRLEAIYNSINQALGTAYDISDDSNVTAETMAEARLIEWLWSSNQRLANQMDPPRMTDFLPRWEGILGVPPRRGDTDQTRRSHVAAKLAASGNPNEQGVNEVVSALLGALLLAVEYTPLASANTHWAGTGEPTLWSSSVAHILVRVTKPTNMADQDFFVTMASVITALDDFAPAWSTFDWGVFAVNGLRGFYFDEHNLDVETFD